MGPAIGDAGPQPWRPQIPEPRASCHCLEPVDVMRLLEAHYRPGVGASSERGFLIIDVREAGLEGGFVTSSINLPARTLFQTRPAIYQLCKQAGIKTIIFYCEDSSSRGPCCAGWMQDYLNDVGEASITTATLKGGIWAWQQTYGGRMMDWYNDRYWSPRGYMT